MSIKQSSSPLGVNSFPGVKAPSDARALRVAVTEYFLSVYLEDGRMLSVPTQWFSRLLDASEGQRGRYELIDDGRAIHWPDLDEDISVAGLLGGPD